MTTAGPGDSPALELRGIHKRFGEVAALTDAGLVVRHGTVHAVLGENGAGKSTLMRVAIGLAAPDAGIVSVFGSATPRLSVRTASRAGLGMVHQHLSLAESLTAPENVALGGAGLYRSRQVVERLRAVADSSGLDVPLNIPVRELTLAQRQRLEILKALAADARVLILDEPTAVLAPTEVRDLLSWVRSFAARGGSVVLVTHKLREALSVADDITVLRRGRVTFAGPATGATESSLAGAIFPGAVATSAVAIGVPGEEVVVAERVSVADDRGTVRVRDASFVVRRHEIVGIAAVDGAGHHELMAALGALKRPASGELRLPQRVVVVPADRHRDGLILSMSLAENVALRGVGAARGRIAWGRVRERARALIQRFGIVAASEQAGAGTLSGGNQQRLVVAAALEQPVDLIVADNPTRGLDLRATAFVHEQLREAAASGAAVVVHSSDVDEVLELATRVLVVFHGTVSEAGLDRDRIGTLMLGAA
ncbi:MAG: ATP-binding cassette domain-containing protein [Gemmatimonadota bacterium]